MKSYLRFISFLLLGMLLLFGDFYSKAWCYHLLPAAEIPLYPSHKEIVVFQDFLGVDFFITLTMNKGAAWGILSSFQLPLLSLRILVALALLIYLLFFLRDKKKALPLFLILVGAVGNVIDFFLYGSVVDFLHFNLWGYHFPVFNVADSLISIGVFCLFFLLLFEKKAQPQNILNEN